MHEEVWGDEKKDVKRMRNVCDKRLVGNKQLNNVIQTQCVKQCIYRMSNVEHQAVELMCSE